MPRETTEIRIDEHGDETHESWIMLGGSRVQSSPPQHLFGSEIGHTHFVVVTVRRCTRKRALNRDRLHSSKTLMEFQMSESQWGAFISSFGQGDGVPATLSFLDGPVPGAPFESRLDESAAEVREAGTKALASIQEAHAAVVEAFEEGKGKKEMRERLRALSLRLQNAPANMEFAAESLTEHVEEVVTKAKADIEAMVLSVDPDRQLGEGGAAGLLGGGEDS